MRHTRPTPAEIEENIFRLLAERKEDATICPSEVARALDGDGDGHWRALMPRIRETARQLAEAGRLKVTRRGVEVDADSAGGPIRLGRVSSP